MTLITNFYDGSRGQISGDKEFIDMALSVTDMSTVESYTVIL